MISRRSLLQGVVGISAGLILPPTLAENADAVRRYWFLDKTMSGSTLIIPRNSGYYGYSTRGDRWLVHVHWPDGGMESHVVAAPALKEDPWACRKPEAYAKVRLGRTAGIGGAAIHDADNGRLLVAYGYVPWDIKMLPVVSHTMADSHP